MLFDYKDFDHWVALAKESPETFESMRQSAIEELIESAPAESQHRLRCRQWQVDQVRQLANNPLHACIKISEMMMESLVHGQEIIAQIEASKGLDLNHSQPPTAKIIKMPERTGSAG
ncbi:MAG TPA: hypothetical protein DCZ03_14395 [Gammaproteobacteria bacterium]|nr:hypothetical protein [Gammaproteobacteria bacterium]